MGSSDLTAARLAVISAALSGDSGGLYHIVANLLGDGIPFERVLFDLLLPSERNLGSRWQHGDYLITEEHTATAAIETVISLLGGSFDQPEDGMSVVVAAAEGDDHSLPARAVSAYLLFLGYRTVLVGANVVASDLAEFLEAETPDALVLSCAMSTHLPGARAVIEASHQAGVPVIAGGEGFGPGGRWAETVGADAWVGSFEEVSERLQSWDPDPQAAEAAAAAPDEEMRSLLDDRLGLITRARSALADDTVEPRQRARVISELGLILDSLAAAILVDDPTIVSDLLEWQQKTLSAQGVKVDGALVTAMEETLEDAFPRALEMLERARSSRG